MISRRGFLQGLSSALLATAGGVDWLIEKGASVATAPVGQPVPAFTPEIWSQAIMAAYKRNLVFRQ